MKKEKIHEGFTKKEIDKRISSESRRVLNILGKIDLLKIDLRATRKAIRMWEKMKKKAK